MTTVNVTEPSSVDYTWGSADFLWSSFTAEKTWEGAEISVYDLSVNEEITISDLLKWGIVKQLTEALYVNDRISKEIGLSPSELLSFAEIYHDNVSFNLAISETLSIADNLSKGIVMPVQESFSVTEQISKEVLLNKFESVRVSENWERTVDYYRNWAESIGIADLIAKSMDIQKGESFSVAENGISKDIGLAIAEDLTLVDAWTRQVAFQLALKEGLSVSDAIAKSCEISLREQFGILDEYVRNSNVVISDLVFSDTEITEEDFANLVSKSGPVGYGEFQRFVTGDYNYQEAMFKFALMSANSDRVKIDSLNIEVDLPDVFDRGNTSIPAASTRIDFNRTFHTIPEIGVILKAGSEMASPDLVTSDKTGFTVRLLKADNSLTAGNISWQAHGY